MAVFAAFAGAAAAPALAQLENVFRPARGFQPAGSYAVSQMDSVNDVTGTVTLRIPLAKVAGRNGAGLSLDLVYNSALYNLQTQQATEDRVMDELGPQQVGVGGPTQPGDDPAVGGTATGIRSISTRAAAPSPAHE